MNSMHVFDQIPSSLLSNQELNLIAFEVGSMSTFDGGSSNIDITPDEDSTLFLEVGAAISVLPADQSIAIMD